MTMKKFDDVTGQEIPLNAGIEAQFLLEDGTVFVQHYVNWADVPNKIISGQIHGLQVATVNIRNLDIHPANKPTNLRVSP